MLARDFLSLETSKFNSKICFIGLSTLGNKSARLYYGKLQKIFYHRGSVVAGAFSYKGGV